MDPNIYNEYIQMHTKITCLLFSHINWEEFRDLCNRLGKEPIYALCLNGLYIAAADSYIKHLRYNNILQGCPCNSVRGVITSYAPPSYITHKALDLLIFKDFLNSKYCLCNDFYCDFKPPYPLDLKV